MNSRSNPHHTAAFPLLVAFLAYGLIAPAAGALTGILAAIAAYLLASTTA